VHRSTKRSLAVLLMAACAAALLAPVAQARPRSWTIPAPWVEAPCDGVNAPAGQENVYKGFLIPRSASLSDSGALRIRAKLLGWCGVDDGEKYALDTGIGMRVELSDASCDGFTVTMPDRTKDGVTIHLSETSLRISAPAGAPLHDFCALADAVEKGRAKLIASKLDALLQNMNVDQGA